MQSRKKLILLTLCYFFMDRFTNGVKVAKNKNKKIFHFQKQENTIDNEPRAHLSFSDHFYNRKLDDSKLLELDDYYKASTIKNFGMGSGFTCVLNFDLQVLCWGRNDNGQLGIGMAGNQLSSDTVPAVELGEGWRVKELIVRGHFTCVLLDTNDLSCWGYNLEGQLGIGTKESKGLSPEDMGNNLKKIDFGAGRKVKKVALGPKHGCVILDDNSLKCWGLNSGGQLGYGDTNNRGDSANEMGDNLPALEFGDRELKDVSVGKTHTCLLFESNEAICFGLNEYGELGQGNTITLGSTGSLVEIPFINVGAPIKEIHTGNEFTCALLLDNKVKCFGRNTQGQLCIGNTIDKGDDANEIGDNLPYANFGGNGTAKKLAAGGGNACVILEDDTLKCWGQNMYCTAGSGTTANPGTTANTVGDKLLPVNLGARSISELRVNGQVVCAIFTDGTFSCWGQNLSGGLGQGDLISRGCKASDMGNNLPSISLSCLRNPLSIDVTTGLHSEYTTTQLTQLDQEKLVMRGREGYYSMENQVYKQELCVPDGTYEFKIDHSLGNWTGGYEVTFKGNLIAQQNPTGYFWQDRYVFSSCSNETHCDDKFSCTADMCDFESSQCHFNASFSSSCRTWGSPSTLVIRSIASDSNTTSSLEELTDRFFGSQGRLSMRSQFSDCSYERFDLMPFSGYSSTGMSVVNGTVEVMIEENVIGEYASIISSKILEKTAYDLGELSTQFDFVIVCLPPGTMVGDSLHWKAYAFVDSYLSIYNDKNCIYPSVQMHELGHNVGLSHSNDEKNYGDTSGMMGISYSLLDGPSKCFNAPKSFKLMWYIDGDLTLDLKDIIGKEVQLVGISNYLEKGFRATHLKIINCVNGFDYFFSFNRKILMNSGTNEGEDQILVSKRRIGEYYDDSELIAKLDHLQRFTIFGLGPNGNWDLQILPKIYLDENPSYSSISFSVLPKQCLEVENCDDNNLCTVDNCTDSDEGMVCQNIPKNCTECGAPLHLEVTTNDYPHEILWDIENVLTKRIIRSSEYYPDIFTSYNFSDCFEYGMYLFSIYYTNSTEEFYQNATFKLSIGDVEIDDGNITDMIYAETIFTICSKNEDCLDYDGCTIDYCDLETKLCNNSYIPLDEDCVNCFWMEVNLTADNFAEETKWNVYDYDTGSYQTARLVESGDPYPSYFHAFGRRKAPTKSGRRKAPTKSGRRKAPTKSGRRKAPTRSSSLELTRKLDDEEENEIFEAICLEQNIKYKFIITDSFGDGICCAEGEGSFAITLEDKVIKRGGNFSYFDEVDFKFALSESICEDNDPSTDYLFDADINACLYFPVECSNYGAMVTILIRSDIYADDTRWEVSQNSSIIMEGGMYELAYAEYKSDKCLPYGSYSFSIIDPPADGMAFCFHNECGYELIVNNNTVQKSDGSFSSSKVHIFGICTSDEQCNDGNECTADSCDVENKICIYEQFPCKDCNKETVVVDINTDVLFSLTSWNLVETNRDFRIASGGPFVKSFTHYQQRLCVSTGTYVFTVSNSEGRGMTKCRKGVYCGYSTKVNNETIIKSDGSFEYEQSHSFVICDNDEDCKVSDSCSIGRCNNNTKLCRFDKLPCDTCNKKSFKVIVNTDGNATETSWNLVNAQDQSITTHGGKYAKNYTQYIYDECIPKGEYIFTINDQAGNGFSSCYGNDSNCGYSLALNDALLVDSNGDFHEKLSHTFNVCDDGPSCDQIMSTFIPSSNPTFAPITVDLEYLDIQSFAVGFYHTCAVTDQGLVFCFGRNDSGQLGYGDKINRFNTGKEFPSLDIGVSNRAETIYAGALHTCIILEVGDLICFGDNRFGQLGIGSTENIGSGPGQMGDNLKIVDLGQGRKVKKVSLGYFHSCALLDDDTMKCWGNGQYGQLGYSTIETKGDKEGDMGDKISPVDFGVTGPVQDLSAGTYHTCIILDSNVKCFGKNSKYQLGYGDSVNRGDKEGTMGINLPDVDIGGNPVQVSCGNSFTCVVLGSGHSKCWGVNQFAQLGYGDTLQRGGNEDEISSLPVIDIGDDFNITYITKGSYSMCALSTNKTVKCWGLNLECSLGLGDNNDRSSENDMGNNLPSIDFGSRNVTEIKLSHWHACVLFDDNTLFCWGFNRYGQLGQGSHESLGCSPNELGNNLALVQIVSAEDWLIHFNGASSNVGYKNMRLEYDVSRNVGSGQFTAGVFDKTCLTRVDDSSIIVDVALEDTSNSIYQKGLVFMEMNYSFMESSVLWSSYSNGSGFINYCIRADLLLHNESNFSVSFIETEVLIDFNFDTKLNNFEIKNLSVEKAEFSLVDEEQSLEAQACICDASMHCIIEPHFTRNSEIELCVFSSRESVKVKEFVSVGFYQDGILKFSPVLNSENMELTSTEYVGSVGVMKTRLLTAFFESSEPSDLFIKGDVSMEFSGNRYLAEVDEILLPSQSLIGFNLCISLAKRSDSYNFSRSALISILFMLMVCFYFQRKKSDYVLLKTDEAI